MRALDRKLWRDLRQVQGQAIAISLVVACGVATFAMFLLTLNALLVTQANYYREHRFADVFVSLKRAPESLRERIAALPGVESVETRIVAAVNLNMPDFPDPVTGRIISIPEDRESALNRLYLRAGRLVSSERPDEVIISESFADAHGLVPGDAIEAVINGRWQRLTIAGTALSPEYIQQLRPGAVFPDFKRFGVMWMGKRALAQAYDQEGAFNDAVLGLRPQAEEREVIDRLDELLKPYGGQGAYTRKDQLSHRFLMEEFKQLSTLANIFPVIFLSVAAFLLNVVISRQIGMQREQIAALKAFGYDNRAVLWHYLKLVLVITAGGVLAGVLAGIWLGEKLAGIYMEFYRFPYLEYEVRVGVLLQALTITFAAGTLGTWFAVRRAAQLNPAEAMRPEAPPRFSVSWVERLGLQKLLSQPARMILRHVQRKPLKSLLSIIGIAMANAMVLTGLFQRDTVSHMVDVQYGLFQREDISVTFVEPTSRRARHELRSLPGVQHVEVFRHVPVRLRHGYRTHRVGIRGMEPEGDIQRLLDTSLRPVPLPTEGIVLTDFLASMLGVKPGDKVTVEVLEGSRPVRDIQVVALVNEYLGVSGYMHLDALNRFMREGPAISGAYLSVDPRHRLDIFESLEGMPRVAGVVERVQEIRNFHRTMDETMLFFTFVSTIFAVIIAFGVVYNSARIALAERSRDLASLRVLGFTRAEISYILLGELGVLTLLAIPLGLVLGRQLCSLIAYNLQNELYRVPTILESGTYAFAASVVLMSAVIAGLAVRRKLDRLDLIAVLKTRE